MGDFNTPNISWSTLTGSTYFSNQLCDLIFQYNLLQLVNYPNRICGNILELFITNYDNVISSVLVHPYNTGYITSDHYLISFTIPLNQPQ